MTDSTSSGPTFGEQRRTEQAGTMGAVREAAEDVLSRTAEMAGQARERMGEWASSASRGAERAWESTREGARDMARNVAHRAEQAWEGTGSFIRRHPIPSLLIGLGIGFAIGQILASRRS
jgi:ElaB/YqjD/DUF883 family membrane-anchored ribosome-binding protein